MLNTVLWIFVLVIKFQSTSSHCIDIHSQVVSQGLHYVPGPNTCTLCICDKGTPKWCKSVLCSPPQNCKSFQVGNSCCEFKCLDDILTNDGYKSTYDLALRLIATAFTAVLSFAILFFLYQRLKRRKTRLRETRQGNDEQGSLSSIGYIAGNVYHPSTYGYLGSGNNDLEFHYEESSTHYSLWKPPGNYFPRGEAPPPYEEAVRSAQLESESASIQTAIQQNHTQVQINNEPVNHQQYQNNSCVLLTRTETAASVSENNNQYVNIPLPSCGSEKTTNSRNVHSGSSYTKRTVLDGNKERSKSYENILERNLASSVNTENKKHKIYTNQVNQPTEFKQNIYENVQMKNSYIPTDTLSKKHKTSKDFRHRTISKTFLVNNKLPTIKQDIENLIKDSKKEFHMAKEMSYHRTLPASLKDVNFSLSLCLDQLASSNLNNKFNVQNYSNKESDIKPKDRTKCVWNNSHITSNESKIKTPSCSDTLNENLPSTSMTHSDTNQTRCLKPESYILYHCLSSSQDDDEDYRSECENCKFTDVITGKSDDILNETMTLQRRPLDIGEEVPYYRTSLTLPTNTKKPSRILHNKPKRESWFLTMDEYSSSDDSN